jgi:Leucine-rich repeat (LRR) protein
VGNNEKDAALIDAEERVDVDEWLVNDMGKQRKGKHTELYESGHLPKKLISRRTRPASDSTTRVHRILTSSACSNSQHSASSKDSGTTADANGNAFPVIDVDADDIPRVTAVPVVVQAVDDKSDNSGSTAAAKTKQHPLISVHVEDKTFLIRVPDERKLVSWLSQETANRYHQMVKKRPILYLETPEGAILSPDDLIIDVIIGKEVNARIQSFESLPLNIRYQEKCTAAGIPVLLELEQLLQRVETNGLLDLSHILVSDQQEKAVMECIADCSKLVSVNFSFRYLALTEHPLLACVRQSSPQLRELRLSGCGISSQDLASLTGLTLQISLLDLSYNSLTDDCLTALCPLIHSMNKLTAVYLIACDFTANILHNEELSHVISAHVTLAQVFIDEHLIRDSGTDLQTRFGNRLHLRKWEKLLPGSLTAVSIPHANPAV